MIHSDFKIGTEFRCSDKPWRCTDVGTRTIIAICIGELNITATTAGDNQRIHTLSATQAKDDGWFNGPPYAVVEAVFDENDLTGCHPIT